MSRLIWGSGEHYCPRLVTVQLLGVMLAWTGGAQAAKIACVGDSIAYGYGLSNPGQESYPAVLQSLLGAGHSVGNFGVTSTTLLKNGDVPYWEEARFAESDAFAPDIAIVMLGTNDSKPQNWANKSEFVADYQELIEHYTALGAVVYVATPPKVFAPGAFAISPAVVEGEVAPLVRQVATDAGAPLIDIFDATKDSGQLFPDTVHPNAAGARLLAEAVQAAFILHNFDAPPEAGTGGSGNSAGGAGGGAAGGASGGLMPGAAGGGSEGGGPSAGGGQSGAGGLSASGGALVGGGDGGSSLVAGSGGQATPTGGSTSSGGSGDLPYASNSGGGCQLASSGHVLSWVWIVSGLGWLFGRARRPSARS